MTGAMLFVVVALLLLGFLLGLLVAVVMENRPEVLALRASDRSLVGAQTEPETAAGVRVPVEREGHGHE